MHYILKDLLQSNIMPTYKAGRVNVTAEKALLMTLWFLANTETYRELSDRFNVTQSSKAQSFLLSERS